MLKHAHYPRSLNWGRGGWFKGLGGTGELGKNWEEKNGPAMTKMDKNRLHTEKSTDQCNYIIDWSTVPLRTIFDFVHLESNFFRLKLIGF